MKPGNVIASYCVGKVCLPSLDVAKLAAMRGNRKHQNRKPYRCAHCRLWHVGSSIAPKRYRQARNGDQR